MKVKFIKSPGYLYDLIFIYILHFNKNLWESDFVNEDNIKSDIEFYKKIESKFLNIPDELKIFFYKNNGRCFLVEYFLNLISNITIDITFDKFRDELLNCDELKNKVINFYFSDCKLDLSPDSDVILNEDIIKMIDSSNYSDNIKYRLLSFFVSPEKYGKQLIYDLMAKEPLLSQYYEKNYSILIDIQNNFNLEDLLISMNKMDGKDININDNSEIYITLCLITKNIVNVIFLETSYLFFLGYDFNHLLKTLINRNDKMEVDVFGKILSDKHRLKILDMLLEKEEMSTSDIAENLSVTINSAFYHLEMMSQVGILYYRNEGRTVFYRINYNYIKNGSEAILKKYTNK